MNTARVGHAIVGVGKAYWYIVSIFIAALMASCASAYVVMYLPLPKGWTPTRARDFAWIVGALVVAVGTPLGWVRVAGFRTKKLSPAERARNAAATKPTGPPDRSFGYAMRTGGGMGVMAALFGFLLGCTLVVIWLSIAAGPFAPAEWSALVKTKGMGASTTDAMSAMLWLGTILILGVAGFDFGVIGAPRGWVTSSRD